MNEAVPENDNGGKKKKKRSSISKSADLVLRSWHVAASGVLFGGLLLAVPFARLAIWHTLAIVTGALLIIAGIVNSRHWPYQGRGVMAYLHIGLLGILHYRHDLTAPVLVAVVVVGVVGSKMPGDLRHWSVVHGRRVD